jgi:hypothetical protein
MNEVEKRIDHYLDDIRSHLEFLSDDEQEEILISVRSHIDEQIAERSQGQPTLEILQTVLTEMDSPESYAESVTPLESGDSKSKKFSRHAVIGATLLPFGIILSLMTFVVSPSSESTSPTALQWIARVTILPLGILAPFACTTLGLMGISQIRNSKGAMTGMPLAFSVGLFYPLLILDFVIFWILATAFSALETWNIILILCLLFLLTLDYFIIRTAWKNVNKGR